MKSILAFLLLSSFLSFSQENSLVILNRHEYLNNRDHNKGFLEDILVCEHEAHYRYSSNGFFIDIIKYKGDVDWVGHYYVSYVKHHKRRENEVIFKQTAISDKDLKFIINTIEEINIDKTNQYEYFTNYFDTKFQIEKYYDKQYIQDSFIIKEDSIAKLSYDKIMNKIPVDSLKEDFKKELDYGTYGYQNSYLREFRVGNWNRLIGFSSSSKMPYGLTAYHGIQALKMGLMVEHQTDLGNNKKTSIQLEEHFESFKGNSVQLKFTSRKFDLPSISGSFNDVELNYQKSFKHVVIWSSIDYRFNSEFSNLGLGLGFAYYLKFAGIEIIPFTTFHENYSDVSFNMAKTWTLNNYLIKGIRVKASYEEYIGYKDVNLRAYFFF